jgi:CheY-like chemotaxis protein
MGKKILVVDDDNDIIEILSTILKPQGYEVETLSSAKNVVDKALEFKPDVIVLDIMFPENPSEGFDIARDLKRRDELKKVPIIVLSAINERYRLGFSSKDIDSEWLPVDEFIEKPIEPDNFLTVVKRYVDR